MLNSEEYYIEPVSVHADFRSSEGAPHALYKRSWLNLPDDVNDDLLVSFDESWKKDEPLPYPVGKCLMNSMHKNAFLRFLARGD